MKYTKVCLFCSMAILWMTVIFVFSSQPADDSSAMSSPIAQAVVDLLYPAFDTMSVAEQTQRLDLWTLIIRKGAHFSEYALLGALLMFAISSVQSTRTQIPIFTVIGMTKHSLIAYLFGTLYAISDEFHQTLVPGRSGQLTDILLDSTGVAVGVLTVFLIALIKKARRNVGQGN